MNPMQPGNPENSPKNHNDVKHSTFEDLSHIRFDTLRFGEITPFMFLESVKTDSIPFRSDHDLRTLSLQSPLMSRLQMRKHYYNVPMECILPLNWEKIYTNPVIGDDCPKDAYTSVNLSGLSNKFLLWLNGLKDIQSPSDYLRSLLMGLVCFEYFYSYGSLLNVSGIKVAGCFQVLDKEESDFQKAYTYDYFFDSIISLIRENIPVLQIYGSSSTAPRFIARSDFDPNRLYVGNKVVSFHTMLQSLRDEPYISAVDSLGTGSIQDLRDAISSFISDHDFILNDPSKLVDISRLLAYQIVSAHYFSDDHIDYVYSAELFRQYIGSLVKSLTGNYPTFVMNGLTYQYDYLSAHSFGDFFWDFPNFNSVESLAYFAAIFSFKRSLKYKDYFTGARSNPLAVGDINIPVTGSNVSVLDVTRKLAGQRFLNSVNRTGRKFSSYLEGLFGGRDVGYDYHNPSYLGSTVDNVGSYETQNTGDSQVSDANSITSNIRNSSGKFAFEFSSDRPSILVGVITFDVRRAYVNASHRLAFVQDRFDMFNPMMQYIGDQEIYSAERWLPATGTFGYTLRNMEYKQAFDVMSGGFVAHLPSWSFRAYDGSNPVDHIGPDFIRSKNDELDPYFIRLENYSLGGYFHFIVSFFNDFGKCKRPMAYAPTIL